jgi:RNA polymerase sigma-70 factor (ECF subfamily)
MRSTSLDLTHRGCSAELAVRILAPLDESAAHADLAAGTRRNGAGASSSVPGTSMSVSRAPATHTAFRDAESRAWIDRLSPGSPDRDAAIASLHALLLKAACFEVRRRQLSFPHLRGNDYDDLAQQSADDALVAILNKLGDFRGDSRFTTWAYKFALLEAAVKVRRRAWQGRELPITSESWAVIADAGTTPHQNAEMAELLRALHTAVASELSRHQREVLVAVALNDVPIDVLAERLNTTRGALYKTIHDARRKLRAALAARGLDLAGIAEGES